MRVGRRRSGRSAGAWLVIVLLVLLVAGGVSAGVYFMWMRKPSGLEAIPNPAVVAPGGFNATIGANKTITVGLEVRNTASVPVTLLSARIVAPAGLRSTALTVLPPGPENQGFDLAGNLPAAAPVQLGTGDADRDAVVAARFTVNCQELLATDAVLDEQIFVTIQVGTDRREEELTPPVVGDTQWLTATAQRVCLDPVPTGGGDDKPLPPQPGGGGSSGPATTP
jgi:hypothetical protein